MFKSVVSTIIAMGLLAASSSVISAQTTADPDFDKVTAKFSMTGSSHFISYGLDVWGGGAAWRDGTFNPSAEVALNFDVEGLDAASIYAGTWWDMNDNANSTLGGPLQEVDIWVGYSVAKGPFEFSVTGQSWKSTGNTESVLDLKLRIDDSQFSTLPVAFNPFIVAHYSSDSPMNPAETNGWAFVVGIETGLVFYESDDFDLELYFPTSIGVGDSDFYLKSGLGFYSTGVIANVPLKFVDGSYGEWALNAGIQYYHTPASSTGNADKNIMVGTIGATVVF